MAKFNVVSVLILNSLLLLGCGFHLRNKQSLPPPLQHLHYQVTKPYGKLETTFKQLLQTAKVILAAHPDATTPILHLTSTYSYNATSSIASAEPRAYYLNYSATLKITTATGTPLLPPQTVTSTRTLTLQANEIFEVTPQVAIAQEEMVQELATKLLNILCAPKTYQALGAAHLPP